MHIAEPLSCQGFYASRIVARRFIHGLLAAALVIGAVCLAIGVVGIALIDFLLISWGVS